MAILTALQLREKYTKTVLVDLPDGSGSIKCRIPDFVTQVWEGLLPMPLLQRASQDIKMAEHVEVAAQDKTAASRELANRWICLVCVEPQVVLTREECASGNICVEDLPKALKEAILGATLRVEHAGGTAAAAEFRPQPASGPPGPDAAPVAGEPAVAGTAAD
jgi:hypothetical protein